jgi:hypothetical protein
MNFSRQDFCKEAVLWMGASHPNVLGPIAINIDPQKRTVSLISELAVNGNIMDYVRVTKANRIRLVRDPPLQLTLPQLFQVGRRYERFTIPSQMWNRPW